MPTVTGRRHRVLLVAALRDQAVADVADGADDALVLGAQLGPQPPDVDVDRTGTAEVVVAPDVGEELLAAEHPPGVLQQVLQQLELGVGEIQRLAVDRRRVAGVVDGHAARGDHLVAADRRGHQAQPRLELGRPGAGQHEVVEPPVGGQGGQPALRGDQQDRGVSAAGPDHPGQGAGRGEGRGGVDEDHVRQLGVQEDGRLERRQGDLVGQQGQ
ncbi:hypothetical protein SDC9_80738 [bioreactor metagenome]|uniref:Uncharacterized protein n=1 Tax=bioreactor metagenome TaxID=1076179 RepID=A0A644Z006_9ZZZZ